MVQRITLFGMRCIPSFLFFALFFTGTTHAETFSTWKASHFNGTQLGNAAISGVEADPDGDGIKNLQEYAFGLDPLASNASSEAFALSVATPASDGLLYTYVQRKDATDLRYQIEYTGDLTNPLWNLLTAPQEPGSPVDLGDVWQRTILVPTHFPKREFLRLRVHQQTTPLILNDPPQQFIGQLRDPFIDIDLHWIDRSNQETGYLIERAIGPTPAWQTLATTSRDTTGYADLGLNPDTDYHYRARAVLSGGSLGPPSAEWTLRTPLDSDGDGLSDPAELNLQTDPFDADTDNDGIDDGYEIAHGTVATYATVGFNPLIFDSGFDADGDGSSNLSEYLGATDPLATSAEPPPNAPGGVVLIKNPDGSIDMSWEDLSDNEDSFTIRLRNETTGAMDILGTVPANTTSVHINPDRTLVLP